MTQYIWSDDRVETLKRLWLEGLSANQVAHALGGVTRNAVIGKVHRLGLGGRSQSPQPTHRIPKALRISRSIPVAAVPVEIDALVLPDGGFATMRNIDQQMCRWPVGDPASGDFHFCGHPHKPGVLYCEVHCRRAYQPHSKLGQARRGHAA